MLSYHYESMFQLMPDEACEALLVGWNKVFNIPEVHHQAGNVWATTQGDRLIPKGGCCHEIFQHPTVVQKIIHSGVVGSLYLVGAMK